MGVVQPFSNECFEGQVLVKVLNPHDASPMPAGVSAVRGLWEVWVQGRFKVPLDNFYMGLELNDALKLGMVSRALASSVVRFVKTFEADVHANAGRAAQGASTQEASELAHIVARHFKGADQFHEAAEGEAPPLLGGVMPPGSRANKASRPTTVRTDRTYTFCTYSSFIDLGGWKLTKLPGVGTLDLASFVREADVRIVFYA